MKMITVELNGQKVQADLLNPNVMKKVRDGFNKTIEKFNEGSLFENSEDGVTMQCDSIIHYIEEVFGREDAKKVFGDEVDLLTCLDVLEEMRDLYPNQVNSIIADRVKRLDEGLDKKEVDM